MAEAGLGGDTLRAITDKLEERELEELRACYEKRLEGKLSLPVQLRYGGEEGRQTGDDGSFVI